MPTVPRRSDDQVSLRALPSTSAPLDAPAGSFGGGAAAQGFNQAAQGMTSEMLKATEQFAIEADKLVVREKDNLLSKARIDFTVQGQSRKGKDAINGYDDYSKKLGAEFEAISKDLNPRQLAMLRQKYDEHDLHLKSQLEPHAAREMAAFDDQQGQAGMKLLQDSVRLDATNWANIEQASKQSTFNLGELTKLLDRWESNNSGASDEVKKLKREGEISAFHSSAMTELANQKKSSLLKDYFGLFKADLRGDDINKMTEMLRIKTDTDIAEAAGDALYASTKKAGLTEFNSKADEMAKSQNLSREVKKHLKEYGAYLFAQDKKAYDADQNLFYQQAKQQLKPETDGLPIESRVPASLLAKLDPDARATLENSLSKDGSDLAFLEFMASQEDISGWDPKKFDSVASKMYPAHRGVAMTKWLSYVDGKNNPSKMAEKEALLSAEETFKAATHKFGTSQMKGQIKDMSEETMALLADIRLTSDRLMRAKMASLGGRKLTPEEMKPIFQEAFDYKRTVPGKLYGVKEVSVYSMEPGQTAILPYNQSIGNTAAARANASIFQRILDLSGKTRVRDFDANGQRKVEAIAWKIKNEGLKTDADILALLKQ